jgi:hypothetical protein
MNNWSPDLAPLLQSPLVKGAYLAFGIALLVWLVTEAASFILPPKWRTALPLVLGPFLGWATQAAALLDFGAGPGSWGRALIFGLVGGAFAIVGHPLMKLIPPFSWLTKVTPSAAPTGGES